MEGNHAFGWGALDAGCDAYCSYPITPQNEVVEWFAGQFPPRGKHFLQSTSELESMFLAMGFAAAGARTMTSTASAGWGLCQEGMSHFIAAEFPLVLALLMRGGPGGGTTRHSQMDYNTAVHPGGQGDVKNIVLAPYSCQECYDLVQLAFHLTEKYRNPVILVAEPNVTRVLEKVERKPVDFDPLPQTDWALKGKARHLDGVSRFCTSGYGRARTKKHPSYLEYVRHLNDKFKKMEESEVRYETYSVEDAEIVLVAYGYTARVSREVISMARSKGIRAGLIRPVSLWPFPKEPIMQKAKEGAKFLIIEDSLGEVSGLYEDVLRSFAGEKVETGLVTALDRHERNEGGSIYPGKVFEKMKSLLKS